jgi:hypothetical protein
VVDVDGGLDPKKRAAVPRSARFAADSLLQGAGFELAVPRKTPGVLAGRLF